MLGDAGKARKDQHAWVFGILRGHEFLGDKVHAVAQRRHQSNAGDAEETRQHVTGIGARHILNGYPARFALVAVDSPERLVHSAAQQSVLGHFAAAGGRDLQKRHAPALIRVGQQKTLKGFHTFRNAF